MAATPKKNRFLSGKKIILLVFIVLLVSFRLYLPSLIRQRVNTLLNWDPMYRGSIKELQVHLWRGACTLIGVRMDLVKARHQIPFLTADKIDTGLSWKGPHSS